MLKREEIEYNVLSLISTWISDINDISSYEVSFISENGNAQTEYDSLKCLSFAISCILCDNVNKYTSVSISCVSGGKIRHLGEFDIN